MSPIYIRIAEFQLHPNLYQVGKRQQVTRKRTTSDHCLRQLVVPHCIEHGHDVHCHGENHINNSDDFLMEMLWTIQSTAVTCLSSSGTKDNRNKQQIACWCEEVQPFKDTAMFWHSIWMSAGRPINTELHRIMKRTRNIFIISK